MNRWLKPTRVIVSIICIILFTAMLVGLLPSAVGGALMEMQLMHLVIAGAIGWVLLWLAVTLLMGRIYCSTVCPMGTLLDVAARLLRRGRPYRFAPGSNMLRYAIAACVLVCIAVPVRIVPVLIDPDSAYTVIVWELLRPAVAWSKELLGAPPVYVAAATSLGLTAAIVLLITVGIFARLGGRTACNTICPAGAILSLASRRALWHFDINTDVCTHCRLCEDACKAQCLDSEIGTVDMSRCVVCFNCTDVCPDKAISYTIRRHQLATPMMRGIKGMSASDPQVAGTSPQSENTYSNETVSSTTPTHN